MNLTKKIIFLFALGFCFSAKSQLNFYEKGQKAFYWGITLAANGTNFAIDRMPISSSNDSILSVYTKSGPGFNLGLIGNWQINSHFDLRIVPSMMFGEKNIIYELENGSQVKSNLNTTYLSFPLIVRFKSAPIKDLRVFVLTGIRYDYNIIPQYRPREEPNRITLNQHNFSMEYGVGIQYFFPYFIFSPEIKFQHSLNNVLGPDQSPLTNSILRGLYPRGFVLSLNFEG